MNTYLAINRDKEVLKKSSSGGVFYSLAKYILDQNGIVFGAAWNKDWLVDMCYIDNLKDLPKLMGSKYVKANLKNTFKECKDFLDTGKLVLYSGTPCQLHGLKTFLKKDYENLILSDIACHGIPPLQIWKDYLETIKRPDARIISINFRLKDPDWNNYAFEVKYSDGKVFKEHHEKNKYMQTFLCDKYLQSSCYNCKFKNSLSCADITIGDAWGAKTNFSNKNGISFITIRTSKGEKVLNAIKQSLDLVVNNYTSNGSFYKITAKPEQYNKDILKKKVGIITLHLIDNFGGILQAFALNKIITEAGYNAETITWKDDRILDFARNNIKLRIFNTANELKNIKENDYDILVVGSDQIWRKQFITGDFGQDYINIPFLQFTTGWNKTRISYAASIGVAKNTWEYNKDDCEKIKQLLSTFNALSVREIQSVEDCKKYFNLNVMQCLDPTLLLDKNIYLELCKNEPILNKDVFVYLLDENNEKLDRVANYCAEKNLTYFKCGKSIESWLAAFRDAKYIITDSFHGCIFSILFNKPFICLYNRWRGNARFDSLVSLFDLANIIYDIKQLDNINFSEANYKQLNVLKNKSIDFLLSGLAQPPKMMQSIKDTKQETKKITKIKNSTYLYF